MFMDLPSHSKYNRLKHTSWPQFLQIRSTLVPHTNQSTSQPAEHSSAGSLLWRNNTYMSTFLSFYQKSFIISLLPFLLLLLLLLTRGPTNWLLHDIYISYVRTGGGGAIRWPKSVTNWALHPTLCRKEVAMTPGEKINNAESKTTMTLWLLSTNNNIKERPKRGRSVIVQKSSKKNAQVALCLIVLHIAFCPIWQRVIQIQPIQTTVYRKGALSRVKNGVDYHYDACDMYTHTHEEEIRTECVYCVGKTCSGDFWEREQEKNK